MVRPNLFAFATSELSQDAFICWLAALSTADEPKLAHVGRRFIAWLWLIGGQSEVSPDKVTLTEVKRQWLDIDVTLEAIVDRKKVRFIIEDKITSSPHSGQLARYREEAQRHGGHLVPVYFKTGYHFAEDVAARDAGYAVVGLERWLEFLAQLTIDNDIIDDYRTHITEVLRLRTRLLDGLLTRSGYEGFSKDYVQFEYLTRLAAACPDNLGGLKINRGTNLSGTPWAHLRFSNTQAALPGSTWESVYHRLDRPNAKRGYYLATRQYAAVKDKPDARAVKLLRREAYITAFDDAVGAAGTSLRFEPPLCKGVNESDVGLLFFDAETNTTSAVLEQFPAVHREFVRRVALGLV